MVCTNNGLYFIKLTKYACFNTTKAGTFQYMVKQWKSNNYLKKLYFIEIYTLSHILYVKPTKKFKNGLHFRQNPKIDNLGQIEKRCTEK